MEVTEHLCLFQEMMEGSQEHVRGGPRIFAVCLWHSEGRTARNDALVEAIVKQVLTAEALEAGVSSCCSKFSTGELIERTYDDVIASKDQQGKVEDIWSWSRILSRDRTRPSPFELKGGDLKMSKALPGLRGGKCRREARSKGKRTGFEWRLRRGRWRRRWWKQFSQLIESTLLEASIWLVRMHLQQAGHGKRITRSAFANGRWAWKDEAIAGVSASYGGNGGEEKRR